MRTSKVANLRIHVERAFERTKKYKIFDRPLQMSMIDLATPLFYVCSMFTNLKCPLVNRKETTYTDSLNLYLPASKPKALPTGREEALRMAAEDARAGVGAFANS